jgi:vitamin K-dependent gamma-carboxylase
VGAVAWFLLSLSRFALGAVAAIRQFVLRPVDIASLAVFRIVFGCAVLGDVLRYLACGFVRAIWIEPRYHFTYFPLDGIRPLGGDGMIWVFGAMAICGLCIALGLWFRPVCLAFGVLFTYVFLCEQAYYLNHFYLIAILSFLLALTPAHRAWSVDAWLRPSLAASTTPNWSLWAIRGQLFICYFYGGLAKFNSDWLHGEPMRIWLAERTDFPFIGEWFVEPWMPYMFAYGGLLLDLLVVPAILWRPTRWAALAVALLFHVTNSQLFPIGVFPWFMAGATLIFLPPDWPRKLLAWLGASRLRPENCGPAIGEQVGRVSWITGGTLLLLGIHFAVQLAAPLRHHFYPGDASWTEEGHLFAWRMKLRDKRGALRFVITSADGALTWTREPGRYMPAWQADANKAPTWFGNTRSSLPRNTSRWREDRFAFTSTANSRSTAGVHSHSLTRLLTWLPNRNQSARHPGFCRSANRYRRGRRRSTGCCWGGTKLRA